ncbi:MAG: hypothetical protein JSR91_02305, partial [Proteobacteria bacterium]|nr:hypothetical protein [Pseudomonadota bacterium]
AKFEAQRNGFTDGANNVTVTVNSPPTSGPNVSTPGAVEVIITKSSQSFIFGKALNAFLGQSSNPFTLTSRAVAAQGIYTKTATTTVPTYSSEGCIVALTPNAEQGISLTSFNNFTADCSIMSNATSVTNNSNASIYMASFNNMKLAKGLGASNAQIWTRGSLYATSYNNMVPKANQALTNQAATINDPYASIAAPSPPPCNNAVIPSGGTSLTLKPGTYCGGLTISSFNNVYFEPGTYYIANGDLYITSVNNVSCPDCTTTSNGAVQGVTFVLTQTTGNNSNIGGVKITSQNNITLNAPAPGSGQPYPGILFYQDRNAPVGTMTSTSKIFTVSSLNNATLSGAIYFPNNRIDISSLNNSSPSANGCTVWIGRYIRFSSYNNNYTAGCQTYGTSLPGIPTGSTTETTTTPVMTSRVVE